MMRVVDRRERFEVLARDVAEPLYRYAVRRVGPDLAQDVVADALLVMWRRLDDIPESGALPWCYAVARRCVSNAQRSQRRQQGLLRRITILERPIQDPADEADKADDEPLHWALLRMTEADRELLRLWAWESLTPAEIAIVLGITANAVSIRLHRARKRLEEELTRGTGKIHSLAGHKEVQERGTP
jgi:RNA polymerase sigma-70 factor (ECF subfamily)